MKLKALDQPKEVIDALQEFVKNPKGFIVLSGRNGTGKTYAAMAVYECLSPFKLPAYDHDYSYFITQANLNMIWSKEIKSQGEATNLLDTMQKTKLLVLDDLGTREPTPPFMDFLYSIVYHRWDKGMATILTTNLTYEDMRLICGDAFTSRATSGKIFRIDGQDRRRAYKNHTTINDKEKKAST